jgi:hypothetical protein
MIFKQVEYAVLNTSTFDKEFKLIIVELHDNLIKWILHDTELNLSVILLSGKQTCMSILRSYGDTIGLMIIKNWVLLFIDMFNTKYIELNCE